MFWPSLVFLVIALATLALGFSARRRQGSLPRSLIVEYGPAKGSTVLRDAILAGRDDRAPSAALLDLAARRVVLLLTDTANARRPTVAVEVPDPDALSEEDALVLDAILGRAHPDRRVRRFSKDRVETNSRLRSLLHSQASELDNAGMLGGAHYGRVILRSFAWLGAASAAIVLVSGLAMGEPQGGVPLILAIAGFITAFVITPQGLSRRFTDASQPARRHLDGLRQYMVLAEKDRIRSLQSPRTAETSAVAGALLNDAADLGTAIGRFRLYEKLLPYAVIFGIEKEWISNLKTAYGELRPVEVSALDATDFAVDLFIMGELGGQVVNLAFSLVDVAGVLEAATAGFDLFDWGP
ncbi:MULTISPECIES: DUF2207 family protein [unclassified Leifsonia]|uniref:DUF2207 family protein n=1 Tax=unclassified Leifsonia TaxID=2663824 RepID=UPI000701F60E|nr:MULTISPECIES: DUF2207 domain-containing protein [unclassified Leifsonia]KQX08176.1 hypothetical protein ASC59_10960 [Leifsonia sp. Root1293]KRA12458.1 hypothetical protein ASD61_10960 [Leifsonia sp. Root60]